MNGQTYTTADRDTFLRMRADGASMAEVGAAIGKSKSSVTNWSSRGMPITPERLSDAEERQRCLDHLAARRLERVAEAAAKIVPPPEPVDFTDAAPSWTYAPPSATKRWSVMTHAERMAAVEAGGVTLVERVHVTREPTTVLTVASC